VIAALALYLAMGRVASPAESAAGVPAACPIKGNVGKCIFFTREWPSATVPKYTVVVQQDLIAHYWEGDGDYDAAQRAKPAMTVSKSTLETIYAAEPAIDAQQCETKLKHIANTGKKTLSSFVGDEYSECVFNYSDDQKVNATAAAFEAIAETMQAGERLKHALRYDRLGLDAEIDELVDEVKRGSAIEVQNIAPVLQSLVDDDRVMERVKRKAAHLMEGAGVPVKDYTP
jgi:hypothetical protein